MHAYLLRELAHAAYDADAHEAPCGVLEMAQLIRRREMWGEMAEMWGDRGRSRSSSAGASYESMIS